MSSLLSNIHSTLAFVINNLLAEVAVSIQRFIKNHFRLNIVPRTAAAPSFDRKFDRAHPLSLFLPEYSSSAIRWSNFHPREPSAPSAEAIFDLVRHQRHPLKEFLLS